MYRMETNRVLRLADSSALLKLLETFKGSRDEGVVFFREKQATKKCVQVFRNIQPWQEIQVEKKLFSADPMVSKCCILH